jgi:hypothetical protein
VNKPSVSSAFIKLAQLCVKKNAAKVAGGRAQVQYGSK